METNGAIIGLFGVVVGAAVSVVGVLLTNRAGRKNIEIQLAFTENTRQRDKRVERLEELYGVTAKWLNSLLANSLNVLAVMDGKITYNQHYSIMIEQGKPDFDFTRVEILIDVYAPELRNDYDTLIEQRGVLNRIENKFLRLYKEGDFDEGMKTLYLEAQMKLEELGEEFKSLVSSTARNV